MKGRRRDTPTGMPTSLVGILTQGTSALRLAQQVETAKANVAALLGGHIPDDVDDELERRHTWFRIRSSHVNPMLAAYQSVYDDLTKGRA